MKKILLIEDEVALSKTLKEYLSREKFEILSAFDGETGLAMAKEKLPDLVLLDIILPRKDGYTVLDELRSEEKTKNIPVIILTNMESSDDVRRALERGVTTYLIKSNYKLEDILGKVKEALRS